MNYTQALAAYAVTTTFEQFPDTAAAAGRRLITLTCAVAGAAMPSSTTPSRCAWCSASRRRARGSCGEALGAQRVADAIGFLDRLETDQGGAGLASLLVASGSPGE